MQIAYRIHDTRVQVCTPSTSHNNTRQGIQYNKAREPAQLLYKCLIALCLLFSVSFVCLLFYHVFCHRAQQCAQRTWFQRDMSKVMAVRLNRPLFVTLVNEESVSMSEILMHVLQSSHGFLTLLEASILYQQSMYVGTPHHPPTTVDQTK